MSVAELIGPGRLTTMIITLYDMTRTLPCIFFTMSLLNPLHARHADYRLFLIQSFCIFWQSHSCR